MDMLSAIVLDDDEDLRNVVIEVLLSLEMESCIGLGSVVELKKLPEQEIKKTSLIFLDVNLGVNAPSGIDAWLYLNKVQLSGRVYFFTAHAKTHPMVQEAIQASGSQVEVLEKPVSFERFAEIVKKAKEIENA